MRFKDLVPNDTLLLLACEPPQLDGSAQDALDEVSADHGEAVFIMAMNVDGFRRDFVIAETNEQFTPYDAVLVEEGISKRAIPDGGGLHIFIDVVKSEEFIGYEVYKAEDNDVTIARFGYNPKSEVDVCEWKDDFTL